MRKNDDSLQTDAELTVLKADRYETGEKDYVTCNHCQKTFMNRANCALHKRTHTKTSRQKDKTDKQDSSDTMLKVTCTTSETGSSICTSNTTQSTEVYGESWQPPATRRGRCGKMLGRAQNLPKYRVGNMVKASSKTESHPKKNENWDRKNRTSTDPKMAELSRKTRPNEEPHPQKEGNDGKPCANTDHKNGWRSS